MNPFNLKCPADWKKEQVKRFEELEKDPDAVLALWNSDKNGKPCNGGSRRCTAARPGLIQRAKKPFLMCGPNALHATMTPEEWDGERVWIVALLGEKNINFYQKMGATKREILGEITLNNLNIFSGIIKIFNKNIKEKQFLDLSGLDNVRSSIEKIYFEDCYFDLEKMNSNLIIDSTYFNYCSIENIKNIDFHDCYFKSVNFYGLNDNKLKNINFYNCVMTSCYFDKSYEKLLKSKKFKKQKNTLINLITHP